VLVLCPEVVYNRLAFWEDPAGLKPWARETIDRSN
jgi:hypothetical protein